VRPGVRAASLAAMIGCGLLAVWLAACESGSGPTESGSAPVAKETNLALSAKATASSELPEFDMFHVTNVNDDQPSEWVPDRGKKIGAWVQLTWDYPVRIQRAELELRGIGDRITAGRLVFSDGGTTVPVRGTPDFATPIKVEVFPPREVKWVRFIIDAGENGSCGLREFRAFGEKVATP